MKQINCLVLFAFPNTFSYKSTFYKSSPVDVLQIQSMVYNMLLNAGTLDSRSRVKRLPLWCGYLLRVSRQETSLALICTVPLSIQVYEWVAANCTCKGELVKNTLGVTYADLHVILVKELSIHLISEHSLNIDWYY